jgi:formate dehydrogenase iron-sulfur subunit
MGVSRRDFLKLCGASAATIGLGATLEAPALATGTAAAPTGDGDGYGMLIDTTRCVGCKQCQLACKQANHLPTDDNPVALSPTTLSIVEFRNISTEVQKPIIKPVKKQCMHCVQAACISVCPVGALYRTETGCVAYDADKCLGCRYCMTACPFGVPKYDWNSPNPKISKCVTGCMADGKRDKPTCAQACPAQALQYGKRQELLALAKARIQENPNKYVDHVYGEKEIGGTSRLYLSGTPFEQLGFRVDLPTVKLPDLTWNAQSKIPYVIVGAASVLSGITWWTHRNGNE